MLRRALNPQLLEGGGAPGGAAPRFDLVLSATRTVRGACQAFAATQTNATADVIVPPGGLLLQPRSAGFTVALRRFSDAFDKPLATVPAGGGQRLLELPPDASPAPWHVRLTFAGSLRACARG
jgi:hypothetical protein